VLKKWIKGVSTTELAIYLLIVGALIATAVPMANLQLYAVQVEQTEKKLNTLADALDNYFRIYGKYPCPARGDLAPSDPNYGVSITGCHYYNSCPAGFSCTQNYITGITSIAGTLPFKTLNLSAGNDAWNSKITYAVDKRFTFAFPQSTCEVPGNLTVRDYNDNILTTEGVYVLVSHGKDKSGSYNEAGGGVSGCGGNKDNTNCVGQWNWRQANIKDVQGTARYDDILVWRTNPKRKTKPLKDLPEPFLWFDASDVCSMVFKSEGSLEIERLSEKSRDKMSLRHRAPYTYQILANSLLANGMPVLQCNSNVACSMEINSSITLPSPLLFSRYNHTIFLVVRVITPTTELYATPTFVYFSSINGGALNIIQRLAAQPKIVDLKPLIYEEIKEGGSYRAFNALAGITSFNDTAVVHIMARRASTSPAARQEMYINNVMTSAVFPPENQGEIMNIEHFEFMQSYMQSEIMEFIIYNKTLSDEELSKVTQYLGAKWGVALK
jgi:hypothetical protein